MRRKSRKGRQTRRTEAKDGEDEVVNEDKALMMNDREPDNVDDEEEE